MTELSKSTGRTETLQEDALRHMEGLSASLDAKELNDGEIARIQSIIATLQTVLAQHQGINTRRLVNDVHDRQS